jgi:hypothetical protein
VIEKARELLSALHAEGLTIAMAYLYGSHVTETPHREATST